MTWPTDVVPTTNMDAGTDDPAAARSAIKTMADVVNDIVAYGEPALKTNFDTVDTNYTAHAASASAHSATSAATASTIALRDANSNISIGNASSADHAMNRSSGDTRYGLASAGSTTALGGDMTAGTFKYAKSGNVVTISWTTMTHSSSAAPSTGVVVPSGYRPTDAVVTLYNMSATLVKAIQVNANGTLTFSYRNWSGVSTADTTTGSGCISYMIGY